MELLTREPSSYIDVYQRESEERSPALVFVMPVIRNIVNFAGCLRLLCFCFFGNRFRSSPADKFIYSDMEKVAQLDQLIHLRCRNTKLPF